MTKKQSGQLVLMSISMLLYEDAFAYLDPGTGSIIIQGVIAAVVGGLVVIKVYWYKLKSFFSTHGSKTDRSKSDPKFADAGRDLPKE